MSTLGKRKEREDDLNTPTTQGSTIFVSNLPYTATSTDLKTLFSDLGPVRTAFVVTDPASGSSKGVGYVSFSIREDANLAFEKVNDTSEGLVLDGRRLRAQWAENKPHKPKYEKDSEPSKSTDIKIKAPKQSHPTTLKDPLAIRIIVVSGLPSSIDSKTLWKKMRKYQGAKEVVWPIQQGSEDDPTTAHVLFASAANAQDAVTKLHAHVFKGSLLSVTLKKRLDGLAKPLKLKPSTTVPPTISENIPQEQKGDKGHKGGILQVAPNRASRLIVRNLPWNITEQDLRSVFLPFGPIHSIHIPTSSVESETKPDNSGGPSKPRAKGYAFVWMLSKKDAEHAIEGVNGTKISAGIADALVRDKQKKKKLRREEAKLKEREKVRKSRQKGNEIEGDEKQEAEDNGKVEEGSDEEDSPRDAAERIIAVDWALSKDKWEEAKAKMQEDGQGSDNEEDNQETDEGSGSETDGGDLGIHEAGSESGSDSVQDTGMEVDDDSLQSGKPQLPPPESGTTLFVRNVPFEATEDELRTLFRVFGPLRYARITLDHDTGRSRGTGFVCFWNIEDADKVIEQSEILRQETTGGEIAIPKKNPFKLPSLLTPDPSASVSQNLVLQGRTLDVIRAVTRDEASQLKEAGEKQREKADKRNIYLLREGIILPNTPAAESLSTSEVEKRTQSFNTRRALLRSNPSLYVSRTRLSVRQLPLFVTERMLKRFAIHAMRAFESDVKAGSRPPLTADELTEPLETNEVGGKEDDKDKGKAKAKKLGRDTGVKQSKIVRQQDRVDAVTGKGRSKGYGFLEMGKHADALRVLRWGNNNPDAGKLFTEWWIEELGDLITAEKKVKKEDGRLDRLKEALEQQKEGAKKKVSKGSLVLEFSIENVQVVKRRNAHQAEQKTAPVEERKAKTRTSSLRPKTEDKQEKVNEHPRKKARKPEPQPSIKPEGESEAGANIGSIIGRKRKEKRGKRQKS